MTNIHSESIKPQKTRAAGLDAIRAFAGCMKVAKASPPWQPIRSVTETETCHRQRGPQVKFEKSACGIIPVILFSDMHNQIFRQGDVMLIRVAVAELPKGLQRTKKVVLALGEVTGHSHAIKRGAKGYASKPEDLCSYVEIAEALALLEHEEHSTITLEPGIYEVRIQREYHPKELERKVVD